MQNLITLNVSKNLITWMVVNKNGNIVGWDSWKETIENENEAKFAANNDFEHDYDLVTHLIWQFDKK